MIPLQIDTDLFNRQLTKLDIITEMLTKVVPGETVEAESLSCLLDDVLSGFKELRDQ